MGLRVDRNILQWFDRFFEDEVTTISQYNFLTNLYQKNAYNKSNVAFTLEKGNSKYWKLYFELPNEYILKLKQNVHPIFREYIYEQISIYNNAQIYNFINRNVLDVFYKVADYKYDYLNNRYIIDYRDSFLDICKDIFIGETRVLDDDLYISILDKDNVNFFNRDKSFILYLNYNQDKEENMLDSLLDLRKSIIINDKL